MKHLITLHLLILTFALSAQDQDPIPMWNEITPDTIYLSKKYDTIIIPSICQDIIRENRTYKSFLFYHQVNNNFQEVRSFDIYKIGGANCNEIYCPKDTLNKYKLTEIATLDKKQDGIELKYSLLKKNKRTELEAIYKTEYILQFEFIFNGEIMYIDTIRVASNEKWKTLSPVQINVWRTKEQGKNIVLLDITENYFDKNKVNLRQTKRTILKI